MLLCFVRERCFGGAFVLQIANCSKSCKSCCLILHSFVTGVEINLKPLIACWLDCRKSDSLRDILGMFHFPPFLCVKAYILKCVCALCVLCFLFCSAVVKASFFRVREHVMLPFHYSRIITSHPKVPVSTCARGCEQISSSWPRVFILRQEIEKYTAWRGVRTGFYSELVSRRQNCIIE